MPRSRTRLLVGIASAAVAAAVLIVFADALRERLGGSRAVVELTSLPPDERAGRVPVADAPALEDSALPGVLDVERPIFPASAFVRRPREGRRLEAGTEFQMPDPHAHFRYRPGLRLRQPWAEHPDGEWWLVTNSAGMREDEDPREGPVDLRVLVTGDSHTDGVCNNDESFANLLEAALNARRPGDAVEVLNAGKGGYSFYHYLGTVERFLHLRPDVLVVAIYGGNDFADGLELFHRFNGTARPPGSELFVEELERAMAIDEPSLAQSLLSCKYFDLHPDQMELALQVARDVVTEIQVTCLRHAIHPVFVYVPPLTDVEWERHADVLDAVSAALEISPDGLGSTDRMADSLLAFLRERRLDAVDMRSALRAAATGSYWRADHHVNLAGHASIADALLPVVAAARPIGAVRVRRAPGSVAAAAEARSRALLSPGSAAEPEQAAGGRAPLLRRRLDDPAAAEVYGRPPHTRWDPIAGSANEPDLELERELPGPGHVQWTARTNGEGLWMDAELTAAPDLRVVVAGDEQVGGGVDNADAFPALLEAMLGERRPGAEVEVVDASTPGHSLYNYLGVLERSLPLAPDAFVMVLDCGNDFFELLRPYYAFRDEAMPRKQAFRSLAARSGGPAFDRSLASHAYFRAHPAQRRKAVRAAVAVAEEILHVCRVNDVEPIVVWLREALDVERERHTAAHAGALEAAGLVEEDLVAQFAMGRALADELRSRGVEVVSVLQVEGAPSLFRTEDLRLARHGHAEVARALLAVLE